jgi:hypothetical protein
MDSLFKAVKSSKHRKLNGRWADYEHRDKVRDGVIFHVKYLGSTLVSELEEEGQSYGDSICAEAIKTIVAMAKSGHRKSPLTSLNVSPRGIRIVNTETQDVISDLDIYRICFCTADRMHAKVFAYIARNRDNETMECHAFLCSKRKIAEDVTLTVAESFQIAKELSDVESSAETNPSVTQSNINNVMVTTSHVVDVEKSPSIVSSSSSSPPISPITTPSYLGGGTDSRTSGVLASQDLISFSA